MQYSIESLQSKNIQTFYPLFRTVLTTEFPGYDPAVIRFLLEKMYSPRALAYWVDRKEKTILTATVNESTGEHMVGFAVVDMPYGGVSFCRWLGVLPIYQRKGAGSALIAAWEEEARNQRAHKMEVAGQPEAKKFYEKKGFTLEGMRKRSYFGIDQYLFGKVIGEPDISTMTK